jgi:hypothetical protein
MLQHGIVLIAVSASAVYLLIGFVRALKSFVRSASDTSSGCGGGCSGCGCSTSKGTSAPARSEPTVIPLSSIGMVPRSKSAGEPLERPMPRP